MRFLLWSRRGRREDELEEEIQTHLQMAARGRIERGETPDEAHADARRQFGNVGLVKETTRAMWGSVWLEQLSQDLRYALRILRHSPGFTAVAVLLRPAPSPKKELPAPVLLLLPASFPKKELQQALVLFRPAPLPKKEFWPPVRLLLPALKPKKIFDRHSPP